MSKKEYKHDKKKKKGIGVKIFLGFLIIILLAGSGFAFYMWYSLNRITTPSVDKVDEDRDVEADLPDEATTPINILVMGVDFVEGESTRMDERRTDTMMVVHFDPKNHKAIAVSVPRDTQVINNDKKQKINEMNQSGGPTLAVETVEEIMDIDINAYILLDYTALGEIVDNLGGVTVTIPQRMKYDDSLQNLHIDFNEGDVVNLTGKKAEEFLRWRKNNAGIKTDTIDQGGDLGRIENQRVFIKALIEKVASPLIITKIPSLVNTAVDNISTNLSASDIIRYGMSLAKTKVDDIDFVTLPCTPEMEDGVSYVFKDEEKIEFLTDAINNNTLYLDRSEIKIELKNASSITGQCPNLRKELNKNERYSLNKITYLDKRYDEVETSTVEVYGIDEKYYDVILEDFKNYGITNVVKGIGTPENDVNIVVTIGNDAEILDSKY